MTPPAERRMETQNTNNLCVPPTRSRDSKQNKNDCREEAVNQPSVEVKTAENEMKEEKALSSIYEPTSESEVPYTSMNEYYEETDNSFNNCTGK